MTKILVKLILFSCLIGVTYCSRLPNDTMLVLGQYELVAYDNAGRRAFTGTISLTAVVEQTVATGQCKILRETNADEAILDQMPRCQALLDGEKITIDMAPSLDDGGLILEGKLNDGRMSGSWMFKSFAGSAPQGKFEAVKKK